MKKSNQIYFKIILAVLILALSGCSSQGVLALGSDKTLPRIKNVKYLVDKSSVGFEWAAIKDARVEGIKVYRAIPQNTKDQRYTKIATIDDRYTTHFVDRHVIPNQEYRYTFTTYSLLKESLPGAIIRLKTATAFEAIEFVKVYMSSSKVVKVLWSPHSNPSISEYIIERKISGGAWKYLAVVKGRLMPEYIDKSAVIGHEYSYRVVARSGDSVRSMPSQAASVLVK